jgi:very-short-patch-repair endonuclease
LSHPPGWLWPVETDRIIASIAAGQHAAVSRRQLLDAGVTPDAIGHRLRHGLLLPMHAGVYRVAGSPRTWHQRIMATTLACGTGAIASHRAAGFLHEMEGIGPRLEVTVGRHRSPKPPGVVVHRQDLLGPADIEHRNGIPRTRPPATLLGLAAVVSRPVLEGALDDALVRGLVSCSQLQRRVESAGRKGRPGVAALAELLAVRTGSSRWTQSEFERRLFARLAEAGIPAPVPQFEIVLPDGRRIYLDFAWSDIRLALEAQSYRYHAGRLAWSRDQRRTAIVTAMGWRVLPVTWSDLVDTPTELIATVLRARAA